MKNSILLKTVFLILFSAIIVNAQNKSTGKIDSVKTYLLKKIVVTATRTAVPEYELASSISIIDSSTIENSNSSTVLELLQSQYGLSVSHQGGRGSISQVYLRGGNPDFTLVQVDGIEMNMPNDINNTFDFTDLSVDNISRIEILRGAQSTLYGSNAISGVINIITKKGSGKPKLNLSLEGGSYNSYKGLALFSGSVRNFNYSLSLSREKTDGFSSADVRFGNKERDGSARYNINSRIGFTLNNNFNIDLFIHFTKAKSALDQFGGKFGDDPTYIYNLEQGAYKLRGKLLLLNGKWEQTVSVSLLKNLRRYNFNNTSARSRSFYDGRRVKFAWQNNFNLKNNLVSIGAETGVESANSDYFYLGKYSGAVPFISPFPKKTLRSTGVYLQDQIKLGGGFFASGGLRFDTHEYFASVLTFRIAPAYIIWQTGTKIKFTYGTGFKAPSLTNLFDQSFGNPNLNPERSRSWDAGIEQYFFNYKYMVGVTYFNNTFDNLFGFSSNFKVFNIKKARSEGVEFYMTFNPGDKFVISANYTYTISKDESGSKSISLLRRPENKASFTFNYNITGNTNLNLQVNYSGISYDNDFSSFPAKRVVLKSHTIINAAASYNLFNNIKLYGRIVNLLNTDYEEVFGYGTARRSAYMGIKFNL
ncbi:MAG TPA: TonB-dependent receptor [Ignavibacteria bacterium]|nr:TonB-dependent receptor [Ignavibacteria bacterium]